VLLLKFILTITVVVYHYLTIPIVLQDLNVKPPIVNADAKKGPRLSIEVSKGGKFSHQGKEISSVQITELSKIHKAKHPNGVLNLKGEKDLSFKHVRTVIRAASKGGLDHVVFNVSGRGEKDEKAAEKATPKLLEKMVEKTIKPREQDLKMQLPPAAPNAAPPIAPLFINIGSKGEISINRGPGKEIIDNDVKKRKLPALRERLHLYARISRALGQKPVIKIAVDKNAPQQRVMDVLNALAAEKIKSVTFIDLFDE